jgi:hypothetical protein
LPGWPLGLRAWNVSAAAAPAAHLGAGGLARLRLELLAPADLVMMRRQLTTLGRLAEAGAAGP